MLDDRKKGHEEYKSTGIKTEYPYLKEVDSLALANAQLNLEKAFKNFLKNKDFGFPKYKCKSNPVQSYTTNNQNTIYIKDSYIKLPKLKSLVKIKLHREIKGIIKSVTISKNSLDHYFVSILCECDGGESRKNILDGARLNPTHYDNRQSAAKPEKESSTTIPREGSTIQAIGIGSGFA